MVDVTAPPWAEQTRQRLGMTGTQLRTLVALYDHTTALYGHTLREEEHQTLFHKLGIYVRANGEAAPHQIAQALLEHPEVLATRGEPSIRTALLRTADTERHQWTVLSARTGYTPTIAELLLDRNHILVRLFTREHFQDNSSALQHCLGGRSLERYHAKSRNRTIEVRTVVLSDGFPVATIVYDTQLHTVTQVRKKEDGLLDGTEPFFPAIEQALLHMVKSRTAGIGIREIRDLEGLTAKHLFLQTSGFVTLKEALAADPTTVLGGSTTVTPTMNDDELRTVAALPVHLDMTCADANQRDCLTEVRGSITDQRPAVRGYRQLRHIHGQLRTAGAASIHLEVVESIGRGAYFETADRIHLPNLRTIGGRFDLQTARYLHAPLLRHVGGKIDATSLVELDLPSLHSAGWHIVAPEARTVRLASLTAHDGEVIAPHAEFIDTPISA